MSDVAGKTTATSYPDPPASPGCTFRAETAAHRRARSRPAGDTLVENWPGLQRIAPEPVSGPKVIRGHTSVDAHAALHRTLADARFPGRSSSPPARGGCWALPPAIAAHRRLGVRDLRRPFFRQPIASGGEAWRRRSDAVRVASPSARRDAPRLEDHAGQGSPKIRSNELT